MLFNTSNQVESFNYKYNLANLRTTDCNVYINFYDVKGRT